jgi:hypothetical protein
MNPINFVGKRVNVKKVEAVEGPVCGRKWSVPIQ